MKDSAEWLACRQCLWMLRGWGVIFVAEGEGVRGGSDFIGLHRQSWPPGTDCGWSPNWIIQCQLQGQPPGHCAGPVVGSQVQWGGRLFPVSTQHARSGEGRGGGIFVQREPDWTQNRSSVRRVPSAPRTGPATSSVLSSPLGRNTQDP